MSKAQAQFQARLNHIILDDADVEIPSDNDIREFFDIAENSDALEKIGNRKLQSTYHKRNEINDFYDAANWYTMQEINDFLASY